MKNKEKNWKNITSWKNWLLPGAIIGVVLLILFNLVFMITQSPYFEVGGSIIGSITWMGMLLFSSMKLIHVLKYALLGMLVAGALKYVKNKFKGKTRALIIFTILILGLLLVVWDLKPFSLYACSSEDPYSSADCLKELAITKKDPDICYYLFSDEFDVDECLVDAVTAKAGATSVKKCYSLEDPREGSTYYDVAHCITVVAKANKDESLCAQLASDFGKVQEECYKEVAIIKNDVNICKKTYAKRRTECFEGLASVNKEDCYNLQGDLSVQCFLTNLCRAEGIQDNCYEELKKRSDEIIKEALSKNDDTICERLGNLKPLCYFEFAKELRFLLDEVFKYDITGKDEQICDRLNDGSLLKTKCYFNLAINTKNEAFCEKTGGKFQDKCKSNLKLMAEIKIPDPRKKVDVLSQNIGSKAKSENIIHDGSFNTDLNHPFDMGGLIFSYSGEKNFDAFKLYRDFRLVDIDGCNPEFEDGQCVLNFVTPHGQVAEVTYYHETVYVGWD